MNRKPQPADSWWRTHQASCNGSFIKISGPELKDQTSLPSENNKNSKDLASFKGKGRTWSEIPPSSTHPDIVKITSFFKKATKEKFTCINCAFYCTESLEDLNIHLDSCLERKIINLADD